jgi:hypothetical protein
MTLKDTPKYHVLNYKIIKFVKVMRKTKFNKHGFRQLWMFISQMKPVNK